jgi:Transposase DDE domain
MFLRAKLRKKNGKQHRYFSVVENRRVGQNRTAQRTVLYLGEINDSQEAIWRRTLEVFDESHQRYTTLSLFPEDREIPAESSNSIQVKLSEMELRRPRGFGNCWLGCELWRQLRLEQFWEEKLAEKVQRETVPWAKVLQLLVVNRLLAPGSEFRVHRQWFDQSAMGELLEADFAVAEKDRLDRCSGKTYSRHSLTCCCMTLTSTYMEGEGEEIPKAKYGYSRDQRFDSKQVVMALVITPEGFPLAYEVMDGNTSDRTTLRSFLDKIETSYGRARRIWVMDRGIPTEAVLAEMRTSEREIFYLVGTPRSKIRQYEKKWLDLPWQKVRASVEVKLFAQAGELYVLAKSEGRRAKQSAMRRKRLARLLRKLRALQRSAPRRDQLLLRIGAARKEAGSAFRFLALQLPPEGEAVTRNSFQFRLDQAKLTAADCRMVTTYYAPTW